MKRAIDFRVGLEQRGQLGDLSKALTVASQLKVDAFGRVRLPEHIKTEMHRITRQCHAREGGASAPLTPEQEQTVREKRKGGMSLMNIAAFMGVPYSRIRSVFI